MWIVPGAVLGAPVMPPHLVGGAKAETNMIAQLLLLRVLTDYSVVLPPSKKEYNYRLCAIKSSSRLTKFLVNSIHIYDSKIIYYKNIFHI